MKKKSKIIIEYCCEKFEEQARTKEINLDEDTGAWNVFCCCGNCYVIS